VKSKGNQALKEMVSQKSYSKSSGFGQGINNGHRIYQDERGEELRTTSALASYPSELSTVKRTKAFDICLLRFPIGFSSGDVTAN
jgi:hypothetical protein